MTRHQLLILPVLLLTQLTLVMLGSEAQEFLTVPRVKISFEELAREAVSSRAVPNASALLLVPRRSVLYVGARDAILALDAHNVSREVHPAIVWKADKQTESDCRTKVSTETAVGCYNVVRALHLLNDTHLYVCGTYAFRPTCTYVDLNSFSLVPNPAGQGPQLVDGKGQCPYSPSQSYASAMADGKLYSGTFYNFLGTEPVVMRNMGPDDPVRSLGKSSWLFDPEFAAAEHVAESEDGGNEDDKVYFFFTEAAQEFDFYSSKVPVPRVARVCTGDRGGQSLLQRKWTSFVKALLPCALPGENTFFPSVRDAFALRPTGSWRNIAFYAAFTSTTAAGGTVSAVCSYSMAEVQRVFSGDFKHQGASDQRWVPYAKPLPQPRPGHCPLGWNSQALPPDTLAFVSDHPLMDGAVEADTGRPWLLVPGVSYSRLLVAHVAGLDGTSWRTALLGTDGGALHRAVLLGPGAPHLVEELQVLGHQEPVLSMVLSHDQTAVVVAGAAGVVRLPVCRCGRYRACWDCVRARDPCCAWDPRLKACRRHAGEKDTR